jgi:probable HAF family extracellular repeat protein
LFTGNFSRALGINASEQVVGYFGHNGFLWQNGRITDLGLGTAFGINDSGQIVGGNSSGAYVWQNGTFTQLGGNGASAINASGQIVGSGSNLHAVLWQNGTMTDLGTLGGNFSDAYGINASGAVVGVSRLAGQVSLNAFLWQNGTMTDLGAGIANGINDSGLVVGQSSPNGPAVIWQNGVMTDLNSLIPPDSGWTLLDATAVNDAGQIAGTGIYDGGPAFGFLLTPTPEPGTLRLLGIALLALVGAAWRRLATAADPM